MGFLNPDGTPVQGRIIGVGTFGVVLLRGSTALKIPRIEDITETDLDNRKELEYRNECNRFAFDTEREVYNRINRIRDCNEIAECINISDEGILLAYYKRGSVKEYIMTTVEPERSQKSQWIASVIKAVDMLHNSNILIYDLAVRNFLIAEDSQSLKMIDFGQCCVLADGDNIATADDEGLTIKVDLFHMGCVIYSIESWRIYERDLLDDNFQLPPLDELPPVNHLKLGVIIKKCWTGQYDTAYQVFCEASNLLVSYD